MKDKSRIKSPCRDKCKYNNEKICEGCFRTMYEIVNWPLFSDEEKTKIIERINNRFNRNK